MKSNLLCVLFCANNFMAAVYRVAAPSDIGPIVNILDKASQEEQDKLVVFPETVRREIIKSNIESGKMFVAVDDGLIVAIKKLYLMSGKECVHVLKDELRADVLSVAAASIKNEGKELKTCEVENFISNYNPEFTYIYNGADYSLPEHRHKGLNTGLTSFALRHVVRCMGIVDILKPMVLGFGLTDANSGPAILDGRAKSILNTYLHFLKEIRGSEMALRVGRYRAFMPKFVDNNPRNPAELMVKPDEESIPGFGYIVIEEPL